MAGMAPIFRSRYFESQPRVQMQGHPSGRRVARSLQAHAHAGGPESLSSYTRLRGKRVAAVDAADVPTTSVRLDRIGGSVSGAKAGAASGEAAAAAAEADEEKAVTQQLPT